ncbi:MAG TPA: hypothetical protein VF481_16295 [Novosphingobium sp.]
MKSDAAFALLLVLLSFDAANAADRQGNGVLTACTEGNEHAFSIQSDVQHDKFGMPSKPASDRLNSFLAGVFGNGPSAVERVRVAMFQSRQADGTPYANNEQWKNFFSGPLAAVRGEVGSCEWSPAQSLGVRGGVAYAFSEVKCVNSRGKFADYWHSFKVGAEISNGEVSDFCVNLGDPANISVSRD